MVICYNLTEKITLMAFSYAIKGTSVKQNKKEIMTPQQHLDAMEKVFYRKRAVLPCETKKFSRHDSNQKKHWA